MFRVGRQKTVWLRGTAGLGVFLTLTLGVRPAFGWSLFGWGKSKPAPAASSPQPPARAPVPPPPPAEMVRGRVAPTAVRVVAGPSGVPIVANNPWRLFDGDGVVGFMAAAPTRVRAELPAGTVVQGLGAYGPTNATLTVFDEAGTKPMKGLDHVSLSGLPLRWNRFEAASPVAAQSLVIEVDPAPGAQADVRELEIWGTAPLRAPAAPGSIAEALLTGLPPSAVSVSASPSDAEMSYPKLGPDGSKTFRVDLTQEAMALSRAFLVYNLEGLPHWSAARRRINGLTVSGGAHAHRAAGGLQVEEISPSWLRAGANEIQFLAANPNDPLGYKVKDLRVVVIPAAGDAPAYAQTAAGGAARALVDGRPQTGVGAKEIGNGMVVDLRFPKASQPDSLLVATDTGDKSGIVTIDPVVLGKVQHERRVTARLQDIKGGGWTRIPLDATPTEAEGVRVSIQGDDEQPMKGRIAELRVTGSPRPTGAASSLTVSYPLSGECVDGEAYVIGFLQPDGTGTLAGTKLKIDGIPRSKALGPDGAFSAVVEPPASALRSGKKFQVALEADFSNGDVVQRSVDIEGCRPPEVAKAPAGPVEDQGAPYGRVVHAGQAATLSFAGATLEIPAGAVKEDTRITVRPLGDVQVPATDETLTNVTIGAQAYRFGPHGLKFEKPVSLTVPYDRFRFPTGMSEEDLGVFFFDEAVGKYHQVQTLKGSASAHTITAESTHFTDFIAATIATPDHPQMDSFNPNLIKDVKSADPAAGVDLIAPPKPSPDGQAHLSFPIWVPPGRMGMQPRLEASYSSGAGNGMVGLGWDVPISSIEVDTRFGVPTYDPNGESETYTLDGELLTLDQNQGQGTSRASGSAHFHRRAEGKFDTIIRIGSSPTVGAGAYTWEVVDKKGVHNFYGEAANSRGALDTNGSGIYRWYLSRSEDAFGNEVVYTYHKQIIDFHPTSSGVGGVEGAPPAVEIYPSSISYTTDSNGQNPGYRVDFEMNGDGVSTFPSDVAARPDPFSSARGGSIAFTGHRLVNIRVFQASTPACTAGGGLCQGYVRRYNFVYQQGEFAKSLLQSIRVCFADDQFFNDTPGGSPTEFYHHSFSYSTLNDPSPAPGATTPPTLGTTSSSFGSTDVWQGAGLKNNGFSNIESDTINGTGLIGAGPVACEAIGHIVGGGSTSLSIPIPLPSYFPTKNEDKIGRAFVDLNGDGLPDMVDVGQTNQILDLGQPSGVAINNFSNHPSSNNGTKSFVSAQSAFPSLPNLNLFPPNSGLLGHSTRNSHSFQFGAHFAFEIGHLSWEEVWNSDSTDSLLADIDGDGFVDLVTSNGVLMNRQGTGFGTKEQDSWGMPPSQNILPTNLQSQIANTYVRTDPVMEWVAPMTGHVTISGTATKIVSSITSSLEDGVTVSVLAYRSGLAFGGDHLSANWSSTLTASTPSCAISTATQPPSTQDAPATSGCGTGRSLFVTAGDRVYFITDPVNHINFDDILWNPTVAYTDTCSDSAGSNCTTLTGGQLALGESYGTSAFTFSQQTDFRLAGKPIPMWINGSAGSAVQTVRFHGSISKQRTSDDVTLKFMKISPGGTMSNATALDLTQLAPSFPAMPLAANGSTSFNYDFNYTQSAPGDKYFFQVSSPSQIDPNMVTWTAQVDYETFCRNNQLAADGTAASNPDQIANDLANPPNAPSCGSIIDCTADPSNTSACHISTDTSDIAKAQNPISPTLIFQTIAPYYQVHPWTVATNPGARTTVLPTGFVAPASGTITVAGTYTGTGSVKLMIRSQTPSPPANQLTERQLDNITPTISFPATVVPTGQTSCSPLTAPCQIYSVSQGEEITFDVFDNADQPSISSPPSWSGKISFTDLNGNTTSPPTTFLARDNFYSTTPPTSQPAGFDQGGGYFHGWNYFEWSPDTLGTQVAGQHAPPTAVPFSDSAVQSAFTGSGPPLDLSSTPNPPQVRLLTQAPSGIPNTGLNGPESLPGPLWRGTGFDDYISAGVEKASRQLDPAKAMASGSVSAFESSQTDATGNGGGFIFGLESESSVSSSQIEFMDMNGDGYPDIVTNSASNNSAGTVYYNRISNIGIPCSTTTQSCESGTFTPLANASFNFFDPFPNSSNGSNLREVTGSQATGTLGISTAVSLFGGSKKPPSWVAMLPTVGLGYGAQETNVELLDINGDGLPDYVSRDVSGGLQVQLNLGYSLTGPMPWAQGNWSGTPHLSPNHVTGGSGAPFDPSSLTSDVQEATNVNVLRFQDNAMNNIGAGYSYFGGNASASASRTVVDMIDINGDGLPDWVQHEADDGGTTPMNIWFNTGDGFGIPDNNNVLQQANWNLPQWTLQNGSGLEQFSLGLGDNDALEFSNSGGLSLSAGAPVYFETGLFGCYGFEIGAGAGISGVGSEMHFLDIDGDGAPDQVLKVDGDSNVYVRKNPAAGGLRSGVNLLVGVQNPLGGTISLTYDRVGNVVDPSNHAAAGMPAEIVDMPKQELVLAQVVESDHMQLNANGVVINPQQLVTNIDYGVMPPPANLGPFPNTGEPSGRYSRAEREFFGFGTLTIDQGEGTRTIQHYDTTSYEHRHLLIDETVADETNINAETLFRKISNTYTDRAVASSSAVFPALTTKKIQFYEGLSDNASAPVKTTTLTYDYTSLGDIKTFTDPDDDDVTNSVTYSVGYQNVTDPLGSGATLPRANLVQAFDSPQQTNLLRQRSAVYGPHGEMQTMADLLFGGKDPTGKAYTIAGGQSLNWAFGYDDFGNIDSATDPTGYQLFYQYDGETVSHIKKINNIQFGLTSERSYDMRFGTVTDTVDANSQLEHFQYDGLGRMTGIWAPQDISANGTPSQTPTVAFHFIVANGQNLAVPTPAWATTTRKDTSGPQGQLETVVFVDGLDRVRQTKKDASVNGAAARIVGGETAFDSKGRIIQEQFPIAEQTSFGDTTYDLFPFGRPSKQYAYDVLDRVRSIETPDDKGTVTGLDGQPVAQTMISYDAAAFNGHQRLRKMTKDPLGKLRVEFLSARGEVVAVQQQNRVGTAFPSGPLTTLTTQYTYDPLSQLKTVVDPSGTNTTSAIYDSVGAMVMLVSPDAGQTEWRHFTSGQLAAKETASLRQNGQLITYTYNLNRLTNVTYPNVMVNGVSTPSPENVTYAYGGVGDFVHGQAGRISSVTDQSGQEVRYYDQLGNVNQTMRTMATQSKSIPNPTYTMKYTYDALGRMINMTYPDNEQVTYSYDAGGKVYKAQGARNGTTTTYVQNIVYNELDQRQYITFGNNVTTSYFYYPDTKRLENVDSSSSQLSPPLVFQKMTYTYDLAGNVMTLANGIGIPTPVTPNTVIAPGPNFQSFTYDDLYQMTGATGFYQGCACGCGNSRSYTLTLQYDQLGNIQKKTQTDTILQPSGASTQQAATTYNNTYTYNTTGKPHAPSAIGGETNILYDPDGNMKSTAGNFGPARTFTWNEDDRLSSEVDSGFTNSYVYDAAGNRTTKRRTSIETWYVNPFYVVKGYTTETKHIMVGDDRVASEMATLPSYTNPTTAGSGTVFYYHPDHLQSTNFTTGSDGSLLQHDEYIATGEVWFQEAKNADSRNTQPWLFNAKELDETGLYAFGKRYYNPKFSQWASPDPEMPQFVTTDMAGGVFEPRNLSAYSYAGNNPVELRDPNGGAIALALGGAAVAGGASSGGTAAVAACLAGPCLLAAAFVGVFMIGYRLGERSSGPPPSVASAPENRSPPPSVTNDDVAMSVPPTSAEPIDYTPGTPPSVANAPVTPPMTSQNVKDISIPAGAYPDAEKHKADAEKAGQPTILTIDRSGAKARRRAAQKGHQKVQGKDLDEWPPAMFKEGGAGASVRPIDPHDNRGSGACIGGQCRGLADGSKVKITVK